MIELEMKPSGQGVAGTAPRPDPCAVVIFGASGDLAHRKLLPGLYDLCAQGFLPEDFALYGFSRRSFTEDEFRESVRSKIDEHARHGPASGEKWQRFARALRYVQGDYSRPDALTKLRQELDAADASQGTRGNRLLYLATPAKLFPAILRNINKAGLVCPPHGEPWSRVVFEKPFGSDLASAVELNRLTSEVLDESQVFRIDHYLGKETVQNIIVFRFANSIFEPVWNRSHVEHVQVTFAESIGVEGRGRFYDQTGVVRDIVQNHLLQVLALVAMEPPVDGSANALRDQKVQVFKALRPIEGAMVDKDVVGGQYVGYRDEPDVATDSVTPTFAAMRVFLDNWRWQGVPFYLRAGKGLKRRVTEIAIQFNRIPVCVFGRELCERVEPNVLVLRIQPSEGIALRFALKQPGQPPHIVPAALDFKYHEAFGVAPPEAYERLLLDAMRGDPMLFTRSDEVEACWRFCDPVLDRWKQKPPEDFPNYERGSWGPACADWLMAEDGRRWRTPDD